MKCSNPQKLFYLGKKLNGKQNVRLYPLTTDYVLEDKNGTFIACNNDNDLKYVNKFRYKVYKDYDIIPCGNCIACRLKKSIEYANRGIMEMDYANPLDCHFITLTYNDKNLHKKEIVDNNGEIKEFYSLCKEDVVKFKKRLRKKYGLGIRIIECGEYGSHTMRPHYHLICYDLHLDDLKLYKNHKNHEYYISDSINKLWNKGYCVIGAVNYETIAYVCRYALKKQKNDLQGYYEYTGVEPEYRQFPQKPALGRQYFEEHFAEIYKNDEIIHPNFRFKTCKPPKYFDSLLEQVDNDLYLEIKAKRKENTNYEEFTNLTVAEFKQLESNLDSLDNLILEKTKNLKGDL